MRNLFAAKNHYNARRSLKPTPKLPVRGDLSIQFEHILTRFLSLFLQPAPITYDHTIDEREHTVEQWKAHIYQEVMSFMISTGVYVGLGNCRQTDSMEDCGSELDIAVAVASAGVSTGPSHGASHGATHNASHGASNSMYNAHGAH